METVLFNIVTDKSQRDETNVTDQLNTEFSVGAFWLD
jgi:hypothetical protein